MKLLPGVVTLLLALWLALPAQAEQPVLRLETGMHTAIINRIAVDRAEHWLVTASDDKTVRVWDLHQQGRLAATLRPPLGDDPKEGMLYAVAIAPDGETVALGGWTQAGEATTNIYLFDRTSGRLRLRVGGLPEVILHLAWSPDGRHLAATLGDHGLRVYRTSDGREEARDDSYGGDSYWADFDPQGRLVTSCYDGQLRLYDPDFRLLHQTKAPGGARPIAAVFSPDGQRLAVGYGDTTALSLLSGQDLSPLPAPDTAGVSNGNLGSIAWSADDRWLHAGGHAHRDGKTFIRRWGQGGAGEFQDFPVAGDTLMDLRPLADGRLLFGAGDPAWGVMDRQGAVVLGQTPAIADFRGNGDRFRLSRDGNQVTFGLQKGGKRPARFSLPDRRLLLEPPDDASLTAPRTLAEGLRVSEWFNSPTPRLNGQPLALKPFETSRSLTIAPDQQGFLLGADWSLYRFDGQGRQKWRTATPGAAWAVNLSEDGRLAVAAFSDGTIRWYRWQDGQELLALFIHRDGQQWVLWTPEGFFDASPGAESLIGFHLNQGKDREGRFVTLGQVYDLFRRPDLVADKFAERNETVITARRQELARILAGGDPPALRLHPPAYDGRQESTELALCLEERGGGIGKLVVRVNDTVVALPERGGSVTALAGCPHPVARRLPLALGANKITVTAFNRNNEIESAPVTHTLVRQAPVRQQPRLFVLAVGIDQYRHAKLRLKYAKADAEAVAKLLATNHGGLFREVVVTLVQDQQATLTGIEQAFADLAQQVGPDDVFVFFVASHGVTQQGRFYLLPQDFVYRNEESLTSQAISQGHLEQWLPTIRAQKSLVLVDACNSGALVNNARNGLEEQTALERLVRATGRNFLTASTDGQSALEGYQGHGVFTHAVLSGLGGAATNPRTGEVTVLQLVEFVGEEVPRITKKLWQEEQFPMFKLQGLSFPLVMRR